jgi:azurin
MNQTSLLPMRILSLSLLFAALIATAGCGGGDGGSSSSSSDAASEAVTEVTITPAGNQMKFEQTKFTVPAGEEITLTFENTATSAAMKHNVVLLTTDEGSVVTRVGQAGTQAADTEYVPEDDAVLAATDLADPGETVSVTFTAPSEPGSHRYICTFPGHYATMQGTMTVVSS